MTRRKKKGAEAPPSSIEHPRPIAPGERGVAGYPTARHALKSQSFRALVDEAVKIAAGAGILALGTQLSGCAEPTCAGSSFEELEYHAGVAYDSVVEYRDVEWAVDELGVATGVVDHPPFHPGAMAGAMIMPGPTLPGAPPGEGSPLEVPEDDPELVEAVITDETK
jgi:hypothetical protein